MKLSCEIDTFRRRHLDHPNQDPNSQYYVIKLQVEGIDFPIVLQAPMTSYPTKMGSDEWGPCSFEDDAKMLIILREVQKRINGK